MNGDLIACSISPWFLYCMRIWNAAFQTDENELGFAYVYIHCFEPYLWHCNKHVIDKKWILFIRLQVLLFLALSTCSLVCILAREVKQKDKTKSNAFGISLSLLPDDLCAADLGLCFTLVDVESKTFRVHTSYALYTRCPVAVALYSLVNWSPVVIKSCLGRLWLWSKTPKLTISCKCEVVLSQLSTSSQWLSNSTKLPAAHRRWQLGRALLIWRCRMDPSLCHWKSVTTFRRTSRRYKWDSSNTLVICETSENCILSSMQKNPNAQIPCVEDDGFFVSER